MKIEIKNFKDLTTHELYEILRLRSEIFVVEQNCVYQDIDNNDFDAIHFLLKEGSDIVAYLRVLRLTEHNNEISFGRVIVNNKNRGKGYARILVNDVMEFISKEYKDEAILIEAQSYLKKFYGSFGFSCTSEEFLEDGIPHYWMKK